jgi:hypothetical protein
MLLKVPTLSEWALLAFSAWYIQYVLRWLEGPFGVFTLFRSFIGVTVDKGAVLVVKENVFSEVLSCVYCTSFWVGLVLVPVWMFAPVVLTPFAIAGFIVLIESILKALTRWR